MGVGYTEGTTAGTRELCVVGDREGTTGTAKGGDGAPKGPWVEGCVPTGEGIEDCPEKSVEGAVVGDPVDPGAKVDGCVACGGDDP